MTEKEFKRRYPKHADCIDRQTAPLRDGFQWYFSDGEQKIVVVCDYYHKEYKNYELLQMADGSSITRKEYNKIKIR